VKRVPFTTAIYTELKTGKPKAGKGQSMKENLKWVFSLGWKYDNLPGRNFEKMCLGKGVDK